MKTSKKSKLLQLIVLLLVTTLSSSDFYGQEKEEIKLSDFLVVVQTSDSNKIIMECEEGCAWKTLTYTLNGNSDLQAIDEYGMADLKNVKSQKVSDLSNFLFTIQKSENKLSFKGIEGTAWTELSFTLEPQEKQAIDQMGMTE